MLKKAKKNKQELRYQVNVIKSYKISNMRIWGLFVGGIVNYELPDSNVGKYMNEEKFRRENSEMT